MGDDNVHISPLLRSTRDGRGQADPHRRRASAEERKRRGSRLLAVSSGFGWFGPGVAG